MMILDTSYKFKWENNQKEFIVTSDKILQPYREKVIIEDTFKEIKSFLEISPVSALKN